MNYRSTVVPTSTKRGAHFKDISAPAEKIATVGLASKVACKLIKLCFWPLKINVLSFRSFLKLLTIFLQVGKLRVSTTLSNVFAY